MLPDAGLFRKSRSWIAAPENIRVAFWKAAKGKRGRACTIAFAAHLEERVAKNFDSIPHDRLLALLARKIKDRAVFGLFEKIVGSYQVRSTVECVWLATAFAS